MRRHSQSRICGATYSSRATVTETGENLKRNACQFANQHLQGLIFAGDLLLLEPAQLAELTARRPSLAM
jgi:hypothetical protein